MGKNWAEWRMLLIRVNEADNQVTKGVGRLTGWRVEVIEKGSK